MIDREYPTINELETATPEYLCDLFQTLPFPSTQHELTIYFQMINRASLIFEEAIERGYEFLMSQNADAPEPDDLITRFTLCMKAMQIANTRLEIAKNMAEAVAKVTNLMNEQLKNLSNAREERKKNPNKAKLVAGTENVFAFPGAKKQ